MATLLSLFRNKALLYGLILVAVVAGAGLLFSGNGSSDEGLLTITRGDFVQEVSVSGKVVAAQEVDLGFAQGGRVARVYVKVGDVVGAGTVLAEIENGDLRATVLQREASLGREEAKLAALKQGTRPEEIAVLESTIESETAALVQANRALLEELSDAYRSADDAIHNQIDQFIGNARSANPQINFLVADAQVENDLEFARLNVESVLSAWQKDTAAMSVSSDLLAGADKAQRNLSQVSALLVLANAALNRAIATQAVTQTILDAYIADVGSARSAINAAGSALTSAVTSQKNAASALNTAQKNLALKKAGTVQADIDAQAAQVKSTEADLESARASLGKTIMRAPFTGVVSKMDLKAGAIASANTSEVSMVSTGIFQIESFVPEVNIALIEVGDTAEVTLDAYGSDVAFGARVVSVDPAETVRDGVSTYRAILQFEGRDLRIRSGMTANVRILTDKREDVLSIPRGVIVEREGTKYVRVKVGDLITEREVTTGAVSSLGNIEILSGLSPGDIVVLSDS